MREGRRVRALTSKLFWNVGPDWAGPGGRGSGPVSGPGSQPENPNNFNAGPGGPGGPGTKITVSENMGCSPFPEAGRDGSVLSHGPHFHQDHPDHRDQTNSANGLAGPGSPPEGRTTRTKAVCRRCGGLIEDQRPNWVPLADGSFEHEACEVMIRGGLA
jgi:hypothetical protein